MPEATVLLFVAFATAVVFDFTNGFHDTPMAVATSISTRALGPRQAILLASVLNLVGALVTVVFFQAKVSNTIAKLITIHPDLVLVICGLLGAIAWNLLTWWWGLPSSSSHAFIGGLLGAAIADGHGFGVVRLSAFVPTLTSLITSPIIGFFAAGALTVGLVWLLRSAHPSPTNRLLRLLQIPAAAFVAYSHGSNDAQKTMAAMTLALVASGQINEFKVPIWVVLLSATAIGFGTYAGGWRIMRTLGWQIYKLEPVTGMAAQVMGATVIQVATQLGYPVSTTHNITGAVMGAGAGRRPGTLKVVTIANIVASWVVTIPAAGTVSWVAFAIFNTAGVRG